MKKKTQQERVLEYLHNHKYVTALDGYTKFHPAITQIHTVTYQLRNNGYNIVTTMHTNKKTGERFARWSLND